MESAECAAMVANGLAAVFRSEHCGHNTLLKAVGQTNTGAHWPSLPSLYLSLLSSSSSLLWPLLLTKEEEEEEAAGEIISTSRLSA